jgi:hypothetical protein
MALEKSKSAAIRDRLELLLTRALPQILRKCAETHPPAVADLMRLVELQTRAAPEPVTPRRVVWIESGD